MASSMTACKYADATVKTRSAVCNHPTAAQNHVVYCKLLKTASTKITNTVQTTYNPDSKEMTLQLLLR